jgi:hypothetical protein
LMALLRSALSIAAGYLTMVIGVTTFFSFVVFVLLGGTPGDPKSFHAPAWLIPLELIVSAILAALGGYVCAWVSRRKQMHHALVLTALVAAMGAISAMTEAGLKPLWSSLALALLSCASVPIGARLRVAHERTLDAAS